MRSSYYPYPNIQIEGLTEEYIRKIKGCLNRIHSMARGAEFMMTINSSGHILTIKPWGGGDSGNACGFGNYKNGLTRLSKAIKYNEADEFKVELSKAVTKAESSGISRDYIATQLSEGVLPATYKTADNIGAPSSRASVPAPYKKSGKTRMAYHQHQAMRARSFLEELIKGSRNLTYVPQGWKNDLQRILRQWLRPGNGCSCSVYFQPDHYASTSGNAAVRNRPPTIGLAHEMVHAYRAMYGMTLEVYHNGKDLEEVITTGFPPYQYERFSENIFRTQYKGEEQRIRTEY
ncbi:MAG: hypothetical protein C4B58_10480 [Deltaproteobacteria bacterium]|nr:MAG: hypothetical protein C4B58_10480 [Deltaproteobacteria bacterium]